MRASEVVCQWTGLADGPSEGHTTRWALLQRGGEFFRAALFPEGRIEEPLSDDAAMALRRFVHPTGVRYVDEDGLGWIEIEGEPGSFAVVDTNQSTNEGGEMAGATLSKEAQASGKSRTDKGAEQDAKVAKKAKVKVRPIPDDYIKTVVAAVKKGTKYSDIEKAMIEAKTKVPDGYKTHYPAIRAAAIRKFGSVAAAREAAGKKNA